MRIQANGLALEVETRGRPSDPAVLLIMGLGAQLTRWPDELCARLAERGFFVIRYDNRDVGLSDKLERLGEPALADIFTGVAQPAYTLSDMAKDAAGVLDALGVKAAHIVGASMGGMIAQLVAVNHPEKTLSLVSIMSTTGSPALPPATPEAMAALTVRVPADADVETVVEEAVKTYAAIGSPSHRYDTPEERAKIRSDVERSRYPSGFSRQMAAIVADGDRSERLKTIAVPALVIHGAEDPLVRLEGGRDTAAKIPGAELLVIPGMGHDLPPFALQAVVEAIARTAERSASKA